MWRVEVGACQPLLLLPLLALGFIREMEPQYRVVLGLSLPAQLALRWDTVTAPPPHMPRGSAPPPAAPAGNQTPLTLLPWPPSSGGRLAWCSAGSLPPTPFQG